MTSAWGAPGYVNAHRRTSIRPLPSDPALRRAVLLLAFMVGSVLAFGVAYILSPAVRLEVTELSTLLGDADVTPVRDYLLGWGVWAPLMSAGLQVVTSVFPPGPSWILAIVNAMLFGAVLGGILTWVNALLAAAICFGISRALGRPGVERVVSPHSLRRWDGFFDRHGILAVVVGRIIPFINPDIVSYGAGLTRMGWIPFLAAIGAGSIPSIVLYSWVGEQGVEQVGWLLIPAVVTSLLALVGYIIWKRRGRETAAEPAPAGGSGRHGRPGEPASPEAPPAGRKHRRGGRRKGRADAGSS